MEERKIFVYAGNWNVQSEPGCGGIGVYEYCESDGSLRHIETIRSDITPGIIQADEGRNVIYTVDEQKNNPDFGMQGGGGRVMAFSVNPKTGKLTELGQTQPSFGTLTSFVAQDRTGDWLVVTNHGDDEPVTKAVMDVDGTYHIETEYSDVTAALYPIAGNGEILPAKDLVWFPVDRTQIPARTACLHGTWFSPDGEFCLITNMKQNRIVMFRLDREKGKLVLTDDLGCPGGTWPRYAVFHPKKRLIYINSERSLVIHVIRYSEVGKMEIVKSISVVPDLACVKEGKRISQSDLKMSSDGKFLYDFYRYTDAVTVFEICEETGIPEMIQSMELTEKRPRGAAISPDGRFMLVANITGTIVTMQIEEDGTLRETGSADRSMRYPGNVVFFQT